MKKSILFCAILILILVINGTALASDDQLVDIQQAGVLKFGTSADYVPFVYYDGDELSGLDVELVQEIGKRLGVEVKTIDLAFDGLIDSVNIGQVDLVGGALAITDERKAQVDFSRGYYSAKGIAVAQAAAAFSVLDAETWKTVRIGVQTGTSFDSWVKTNLVGSGAVNTQNIYHFAGETEAMDALKAGEVDVVMIDEDPYNEGYKDSGDFKVVVEKTIDEVYAFAGKQGSTLIAAVNKEIDAMMADGTAQKIADKYFSMVFDTPAQASIKRPPQTQTITSAPATVTMPSSPSNCRNGMQFMADLTIPDGTREAPGSSFKKVWRIYNTGTCTWDTSYHFSYVSGDNLQASSVPIEQNVAPGQTYDVSVDMVAPANNGSYKSFWQMRAPQGTGFGQTIWVKISVSGGTAGSSDGPVITQFEPEYYSGDSSYCPRVHFATSNASQLEFYMNNAYVWGTTDPYGVKTLCTNGGAGNYSIGIVAKGPGGSASYAFNYTNTGAANVVPVVQATSPVVPVVQATPNPVIPVVQATIPVIPLGPGPVIPSIPVIGQ